MAWNISWLFGAEPCVALNPGKPRRFPTEASVVSILYFHMSINTNICVQKINK